MIYLCLFFSLSQLLFYFISNFHWTCCDERGIDNVQAEKVGVDERDDFLAEIAMMKRVGIHPNIVVMLACITVQQPLSMVLEYVPYGDLLHYLRTLRTVYHQSKGLFI